MGFESHRSDGAAGGGAWSLLRGRELALLLVASSRRGAPEGSPRLTMNLSVGDLDAAVRRVREHGGTVDPERRTSVVGAYVRAADPAGHAVHLIDHPEDDLSPGDPPRLFNVGIASASIPETERFVGRVGIPVATRDYLPRTLVFEKRGATYLIAHPGATPDGGATDPGSLLLHAPALEPVVDAWLDEGFPTLHGAAAPSGLGGSLTAVSPDGIPFEIAVRAPVSAQAEARARAAFERIAALAGSWRAESTRGWGEEVSFEVLARGSAVMSRLRFADAPDRSMVTFYVLDGARLLVTHICEARNQPRFQALVLDDAATRIELRFLDGTGLESRDRGHMDSALLTFESADAFTSRWSWYQDGVSRPAEEIRYVRIPAAGSPAGGETD
jgi:hypothetical protein